MKKHIHGIALALALGGGSFATGAEIVQNGGFESGLMGWRAQDKLAMEVVADGVSGKAVKAANRANYYASPAQNILAALLKSGPGEYKLGIAAKAASDGPAKIQAVIRLDDDSGPRWITGDVIVVTTSEFKTVSSLRTLKWTGTLKAALIYFVSPQSDAKPADVIVDNLSLVSAATSGVELVQNGGFENGLAGWTKQQKFTSEVIAGGASGKAVKITQREGRYASPMQNVREALVKNGAGFYELIGSLKAVSQPDKMLVVLRIEDDAGTKWIPTAETEVTAAEFQTLSVRSVVNWTGTLKAAYVYMSSRTNFDVIVDSFSLVKLPEGERAQLPKAVIGAIRWDVWVGDLGVADGFQHGLWNEAALSPEKFHDRIPFYGEVLAPDKIQARFTGQEVMDKEIAYAVGALDYWAFLDYPAWSAGTAPMHTALDLYLKSVHKRDLNFCIILNQREWWQHLDVYLGYFKEASYQKVFGDRPLVYCFVSGVSTNRQVVDLLESSLAKLAIKSLEQGTGDPYFVVMDFYAAQPDKAFKAGGFQAVSSYAHPMGANGDSYSRLARHAESNWDYFRRTDKPVIPTCMTGWDVRPRFETQVCPAWKKDYGDGPNWFQLGRPAEIAAHILKAVEWNQAHPAVNPANAVVIYNWNEFSEGGWLCPTFAEGDARLRAIERARKKLGV